MGVLPLSPSLIGTVVSQVCEGVCGAVIEEGWGVAVGGGGEGGAMERRRRRRSREDDWM